MRLPLVLTALALTAACGGTPAPLLDRPAAFARGDVVWAQGTVLHAGERTWTLERPVEQVWPTPYGFLLALETGDGRSDVVFFDGTTTTPVPGDPQDVRVSPDGRHAGWFAAGPERPTGRVREAVVVDLRTGAEVLRDRTGMGEDSEDVSDLYEEVPVQFLGFDAGHAYWTVPEGELNRRRADLSTGEVEPAGRRDASGDEVPVGEPGDRQRGTPVLLDEQGRALTGAGSGYPGLRSPDGRWCVSEARPGRLPVTDCTTGAAATPRHPAPSVRFGGWLDGDSHVVLARADDATPPYERGEPDPTAGVLAVCDLPRGDCRTVAQLRGTGSVALAGGEPVEQRGLPLVEYPDEQ